MKRNFDEHSIRRYLLRQLSEDQHQAIEKRLLGEHDFLEELEATEAQLLDDYVAGRLNETECKHFDANFLVTPDRQKALQFARVLNRYVASHPTQNELSATVSWWQRWESQGWGLRVAAAGLALAMIAVALWFAVPRPVSQDLLATIGPLPIGSRNRAEGSPVLKKTLPAGDLKVILQLPVIAAPTAGYRISLVEGDGNATTLEPIERDAQTLSVVIPHKQLKRGSYALKLIKLETDGTEYPVNGSYIFALE
jgi:hypothetical protein